MKRIPAYIVPNTHWDREWVMTLGQFKVRLGHLMDKALDLVEKYPEYRFMLDGQSIVLEDYLDGHDFLIACFPDQISWYRKLFPGKDFL